VQAVVDKMVAAIKEGRFEYSEFFPGSAMAARFQSAHEPAESKTEGKRVQEPEHTGPTFSDFADQWVQERSIEWRRSHIRSLLSTLDGRLKPYFGSKVVSSITKTD